MADLIFDSAPSLDGSLLFGDTGATIGNPGTPYVPSAALVFDQSPSLDGSLEFRLEGQEDPVIPGVPYEPSAALLFRDAPASDGALVFDLEPGETGGGGIDTTLAVAFSLPAPGVAVRVATATPVRVSMALAGPSVAVRARYASNTQRPLVAQSVVRWQDAETLPEAAVAQRWQNARHLPAESGVRWQDAKGAPVGARILWRDAQRRQREGVRSRYQDGQPLHETGRVSWTDATRASRAVGVRYQAALPVQQAVRTRFQDGIRNRGEAYRARYQDASPFSFRVEAPASRGRPISVGWATCYQDAAQPIPGFSAFPEPPIEPPEDPCYTPDPALLFRYPAADFAAGQIVFFCDKHDGSDPGQAPLFIPLLKVYMATHSLQAVLLPSLERVPLMDVTLEADEGNPTWSLAGYGPASILEQLRGATNAPRQIRVTLDGMPWVFAIDGFSRSRRPGERRVQIRGHSVTSLLGASTLPAQTWLNANARTAQQLVAEALEFSGVGVDWQIPDWLVPAGAWSFQGKPLAAAVRVAAAVDAVLQSHPTEATLQFLSRYPLMPWEWMAPTTVPDVSVPSAVITVDDTDYKDEPEWEAVYVSGTTQGVMGRAWRSGTAASVLAPLVTDDLITHADAARERGRAILGRGGRQAETSIGMPILTGGTLPGALRVNQLLEVVEPDETWRGMVRGVRLRGGMEEVRQTLRVERHFA